MSSTNERKQENRNTALNNAVRHRLATETPDDIVKAAEKYYAFLQGDAKTD